MRKQPFTIVLHVALAIILAGAFVTHFFGIQGSLTLYTAAKPTARFDKESGPGYGDLPFSISLCKIEIDYYPATTTPMDYRSILKIEDTDSNDGVKELKVSINKVGEYRGWRFFQSGMGGGSTTLSVSYDPWGTGITYTGYALLAIGMVGFFFQRDTPWRSLLRSYRKTAVVSVLTILSTISSYADVANPGADTARPDYGNPPVMQRPLAANLGKVLVYWNDRICPLQTMARDVTSMLYGGYSYDGMTADQVLSGWLFYFDRWQRDYLLNHPELNKQPPFPITKKEKKNAEQLALIKWLGTGEAFRIYPYLTLDGRMEWLSLTARKPSGMTLEQWEFMQTTMPEIKTLLQHGKNIKANEVITRLIDGQRKYGGYTLPTPTKVKAELLYNRMVKPLFAAILALFLGISLLTTNLRTRIFPTVICWLLLIYIAASMVVMWYVGGHVPVSNGPETMMFMGLAALIATVIWSDRTIRGSLLVVASMALSVAVIGSRTPQIGAMMPVLASPLLSIHVMVVMVAYALFLLIAILSLLILLPASKLNKSRLSMLTRLLLTPAVCMLGTGIFIGAVWANQTWGRYWGWDPKETCALVMWLVYALPLHWGNRRLKMFRREKPLAIYLLLAVLTVIFTYFGANYLLPGLHSYA